jgi:hypothetical protein
VTTPVTLKAGETLVPMLQSAWREHWSSLKLVNEHKFKGVTYWWCEMTNKTGMTHLDTMSIDDLRTGWVRKSSFFELGKRYKFRSDKLSRSLFDVIELHLNEQPRSPNYEVQALVRVTDTQSLTTYLTVLNREDYNRMERA